MRIWFNMDKLELKIRWFESRGHEINHCGTCNASLVALLQSRTVPWSGAWQHTPVLLPGESHWQRSLAGYSPGCRKELDVTLPLNNISHSLNPQHLVTTILLSVFMSSAFLGSILRCYHTYHLSFSIRCTALSMMPEDPRGREDQDFLSHDEWHSTSRVCFFFSMSSLTHNLLLCS